MKAKIPNSCKYVGNKPKPNTKINKVNKYKILVV